MFLIPSWLAACLDPESSYYSLNYVHVASRQALHFASDLCKTDRIFMPISSHSHEGGVVGTSNPSYLASAQASSSSSPVAAVVSSRASPLYMLLVVRPEEGCSNSLAFVHQMGIHAQAASARCCFWHRFGADWRFEPVDRFADLAAQNPVVGTAHWEVLHIRSGAASSRHRLHPP